MKRRILSVLCAIMLACSAAFAETATVTVDGVGERVTVTLAMDGDHIKSVEASSDNSDADARGRESLSLIASAMIEKNSVNVDAVAGATCTSNAVIAAATEAWLQITTQRMRQEAWMQQSSPEKKAIGILGGMGPLATSDLMRKIINITDATSDNEHVRIFIDSNTAIPDRTAAILHDGPDPFPEMLSALKNLEACGADCILVSCNTAHYFLPRLQAETDIPILNMPEITAKRCAALYPGKTAAILATTGTLEVGLYDKALAQEGVDFLVPDDAERAEIMRFIYDVVKASAPIPPEDLAWSRLLNGLRERGADYFILACTELPILAEALNDAGPFVDPTQELAREAVLFCGYPVIGENSAQ